MSNIDLKTAVGAAYEYFQAVKDMMGAAHQLKDLRLEEVELSEDRRFWLITLGFERSGKARIAGSKKAIDLLSPPPQREYKLFKVNTETGEVEAMKIREV